VQELSKSEGVIANFELQFLLDPFESPDLSNHELCLDLKLEWRPSKGSFDLSFYEES
jgi:hypothetical protein